MSVYPLEFSIVVAGSACNPTVLNPDFLQRRDIVPEAWGWQLSQPAITTPPIAVAAYDSGVVIQVETSKVQIKHLAAGDLDIAASRVPAIAKRYISELPHVHYTAVGINFRHLVQVEDAEEYLQRRFLREGVWLDAARGLQALSLTLVYPLPDGRLNLALDGGTAAIATDGEMEQKPGIIAAANFHRDCAEYPSHDRIVELVGHWNQDLNYNIEVIEAFLDCKIEQDPNNE